MQTTTAILECASQLGSSQHFRLASSNICQHRPRFLTVAGADVVRESSKIVSLAAKIMLRSLRFLEYFGNSSRLGFLHMFTREMSETDTHNNNNNNNKLRRIPFKVRAIRAKNYLLQIYSQHGNFLNAI